MKWSYIVLVSLAGCAAPIACKPVIITQEAPPRIVDHYIVVHDKPSKKGANILQRYQDLQQQEKAVIKSAPASTIYQIDDVDIQTRKALEPITKATRKHPPSNSEIQSAIQSVGNLQTKLSTAQAGPHVDRFKFKPIQIPNSSAGIGSPKPSKSKTK